MKRPSFIEPQDLWECDGSFRDVYLRSVSESDWVALFALAAEYEHQYSFDGASIPLTTVQSIFANRERSHLLQITVGGALVNCHFFEFTKIELDIDPREVVNETTHQEVLRFLELLSHRTQKRLWLTPENSPSAPYLSYKPTSSAWTVHDQQFPTADA